MKSYSPLFRIDTTKTEDCRSAKTKRAGFMVVDDEVVGDLCMCCHCGGYWVYRVGSGAKRGFCKRCNDLTCGAHACMACVPMEAQVAALEEEAKRTAGGIILPD